MSTGGGEEAGKLASRQELPKRFYTSAEACPHDGRFVIELDGKPARTPGKVMLAVPNLALAEAIAEEWAAQGERISPLTMPLTRLANTTIDGVIGREDAVVADMARYAGSDLLCYRADFPDELAALQARAWDPVLDWARSELGLALRTTVGVMPVAQPDGVVEAAEGLLSGRSAFDVAALHSMTTLLGSLVLALAIDRGRLTAEEAWAAAHVDEDWQIRQWGEDWAAAERRRSRRGELEAAVKVIELCR